MATQWAFGWIGSPQSQIWPWRKLDHNLTGDYKNTVTKILQKATLWHLLEVLEMKRWTQWLAKEFWTFLTLNTVVRIQTFLIRIQILIRNMVSRLGFYLWAASLEKTAPSKVFLNIVLVSCVYPRFWQFVSKTELEFVNNLWGLGTE